MMNYETILSEKKNIIIYEIVLSQKESWIIIDKL